MTTLKEIKKAVTAVLKKAYPENKVYGVDTTEGYEKPSFFVYVTQTFSETTKNAAHKNVEIEVDFVQNSPNESEAMEFFEKMERIFHHKLDTGKRKLTTSDFSMEFQGEHQNIPCFFFNLEFWDAFEKEPDNSVYMGEMIMRQEVK